MRFSALISTIATTGVMALFSATCRAADADKPNILFIIADDLGYGDVGVLYQNARMAEGKPAFSTPHLDELAASGMLLRQHYTGSPVCAPARASLQTGLMQGTCPIRDNQFDKPIPEGMLTLGSVLQKAGYHTGAIGKWGLGGKNGSGWPAHPMKRGYDEFFGFMMHGFGHVYYHDKAHPLMDGEQTVRDKYENVYSTDLFTARAKKFITDQETANPKQPFFLYLAYTAVHVAQQVPGEPYPAGAGLNGGLHWPLTPTPETRDKWIHPDYADKPWTEPMKRYATMARRLDDGVGDILQLLKDLHIDQNTLVVFTSDNGPENYDHSDPRLFDSWGPFDGFKRDVFEGGVREPTMVAWPGHVPAGKTDDTVSGFWDWMPTLADVAGLPGPAQSDGTSLLPTLLNKKGRAGDPFVYIEYHFNNTWKQPALKDVAARKGAVRGDQQMVRIGDFVGVRTMIQSPDDPLRLYNIMTDAHEDHNLASQPGHADLLKQMTDLLVTARRPLSDAKRPYDDVLLPAVEPAQKRPSGELSGEIYPGSFPYAPDLDFMKPGSTFPAKSIAVPGNVPNGPFAMLSAGYLSVPTDGTYTFNLTCNGAAYLWLHHARVFAVEQTSADHPLIASVNLRAGLHPIRIEYVHNGSEKPVLSLKYAGPNVTEQDIPAAALSGESAR